MSMLSLSVIDDEMARRRLHYASCKMRAILGHSFLAAAAHCATRAVRVAICCRAGVIAAIFGNASLDIFYIAYRFYISSLDNGEKEMAVYFIVAIKAQFHQSNIYYWWYFIGVMLPSHHENSHTVICRSRACWVDDFRVRSIVVAADAD